MASPLSGTPANVGGAGIDNEGKALPQTTIDICKAFGRHPVRFRGRPQVGNLPPEEQPERGALLPLRKIFGLYANLRPAIIFPSLTGASSLKEEVIAGGFNVLVVRELTGGIYFSQPKGIEGEGRNRSASTPCVQRAGDRAHHPCGLPGSPQAQQEGLLHRQGQRAFLVGALARSRH
jgi:isocitrate/isopropylmalate dehydrogenase